MKFNFKKYQHDMDVYSTPDEAKSKSVSLGLGGAIHIYDLDGQAYYIPGESHEAYLASKMPEDAMEPEEDDEAEDATEDRMIEAIRAVIAEIMGKSQTIEELSGKILKFDKEQRMVYGWASVVTEKGEAVVDRQGDVIKPDVMLKAVNQFMEYVRVGKEMHDGKQVGVVVHSWPVTDDICKAVGIQSDREGWIVAFKVYDEEVWAKVKSGQLGAFSIGGRAVKEAYNG